MSKTYDSVICRKKVKLTTQDMPYIQGFILYIFT